MPLSFLHPLLFAIGAACVSIPIIIHLLKRRRRVVPWGAMRFLEEAYRKRRRIITLEQLILLALRCLLVFLIALGVGSIVLGSGGSARGPRTLVVVLDDSIASGRLADGGAIIEQNKRQAIAQLDALDPMRGDRVALISASSPARAVVLPPSDDLGAVRSLIEQAQATDAPLDLAGVIELVAQVEPEPDRPSELSVVLASDSRPLARAVSAIQASPTRIAVDSLLLPEPDAEVGTNVGIISATPTRTLVVRDGLSLPEAVRIELLRSGDVDADADTQVTISDTQGNTRGSGVVSWRQGEREAVATIALRTQGLQPAASSSAILRVRLGDDVNPRDNESLVTIPIRNSLRVAIVDRPRDPALGSGEDIAPARWARAALSPRPNMGVQMTSVDAAQAAARLVPGVDAVFVLAPAELSDAAWDRLARLRDQGVMLVITPDAERDSLAWFDRVHELEPDVFGQLQQLETHEPPIGVEGQVDSASILSGIASDFEAMAGAVSVDRTLSIASDATPIALLSNGMPMGVQVSNEDGSGVLVVLSVPFDLRWSNLTARPLFVAMIQELVRQGVGVGETIPPVLAGTPTPDASWVESTRPIELAWGGQQAVQELGQEVGGNRIAGAIALRDAQGTTRGVRVVRPDATGAGADLVDPVEVTDQLGRFVDAASVSWIGSSGEESAASGAEVRTPDDGRRFALWMLWAALAVGVLEFVLARLFTARLIASERAMGAEGRGARA
ncbi:MAG: BatA domain-containing protein [Phycisphaerales bacterium]